MFLKEIVNLETFLKTFQKVVDIFRIILYTNFCRETRDHSSAGRASALQAEGHRFEPYWSHNSNKRRKIYMPTLIEYADMAQLAEQLICNQQVIGSSPIVGFVKS